MTTLALVLANILLAAGIMAGTLIVATAAIAALSRRGRPRKA